MRVLPSASGAFPAQPMQITGNTTRHPADLFVFTNKDGQKHCIVVVKSTFDVRNDGHCVAAEEQAALVYTDEHHGDPGTTAIARESDFAPMKPLSDVVVRGDAIAPGGRPVSQIEVALAWKDHVKRAIVTGNRTWVQRWGALRPTPPQTFTGLPLAWHHGYGGVDHIDGTTPQHAAEMRNPVGRGFHIARQPNRLVGCRLPNIETAGRQMANWSDRCDPIGFGPTGRGWQPRLRYAGTYDQRWMDERLPFLPEDFDLRYFQSAPMDQQVERLNPGDTYACMNMSTDGPFVARLPPWQVPIEFRFEYATRWVDAHPDTLILEPGLRRVLLVARAQVLLPRKLTDLREVHVGRRRYQPAAGKRHYSSLALAVQAQPGRRGRGL